MRRWTLVAFVAGLFCQTALAQVSDAEPTAVRKHDKQAVAGVWFLPHAADNPTGIGTNRRQHTAMVFYPSGLFRRFERTLIHPPLGWHIGGAHTIDGHYRVLGVSGGVQRLVAIPQHDETLHFEFAVNNPEQIVQVDHGERLVFQNVPAELRGVWEAIGLFGGESVAFNWLSESEVRADFISEVPGGLNARTQALSDTLSTAGWTDALSDATDAFGFPTDLALRSVSANKDGRVFQATYWCAARVCGVQAAFSPQR